MPRYAPLPSVSIDPRNEAQLVQSASQRVYEASNQTLNDFSAGNPLAALLEGQAFAQGEFLFWANQLPDKILLEWIGPFLGAMRRLGTPAVSRIIFSASPSESSITIPAGLQILTNPNLTGGESYTFLLDSDVIISPGQTQAFGSCTSEYVGSIYNVPANSITNVSGISIEGLSVTNPQPAIGGSNVETYRQVQERFFTLIRRKNPVSEVDWQNLFIDLYGIGTICSVQPNRPSPSLYNFDRNYLRPNGQLSLFVLGPNATELTDIQLERGQNIVNLSTPVEMKAYLYPFSLSQVQYNLTVEVNANGPYGGNLRDSSLSFRNRLYNTLTPGIIFPASNPPSVGEVDSAFNASIDGATRYIDPNIIDSKAYNTPSLMSQEAATYANIFDFQTTEYLMQENDLVVTNFPAPVYYPVIDSFTPYSAAKPDQTIYGNLQLKQIKLLAPGVFSRGDVAVYVEAGVPNLRVVLQNIVIQTTDEIPRLIAENKISGIKQYSPWEVGRTYQNEVGGLLNPELVQYDYDSKEYIPSGSLPVSLRPGTLAWYVSQNFTLQPETNDLDGALAQAKIGSAVDPLELLEGNTYYAGSWVKTLQVGSGPNAEIDPYYFYVDIRAGAVTKYAYVESTFTYLPQEQTVSSYFDTLVAEGTLKEISLREGQFGLPIYYYKPRFKAGQYLEYKTLANADSNYYIAAQYFTPSSTNVQDLIEQGLVIQLTLSDSERSDFESQVARGFIDQPIRMFTFFKGDQTFFRDGTEIKTYIATESVTPLFEFYIYLNNGVFVPLGEADPSVFLQNIDYIPYFNPLYSETAEDIVISEDGKNFYRVMKAFTPGLTTVNWTGLTVANTARAEEYEGNLLRIVQAYQCNEQILSQQGEDISSVKLGVAQITIIPKNIKGATIDQQQYRYVWENTNSNLEVPELSWAPGSTYVKNPPDYGNGTLSL